jgi:hypothetical protein
LTKYANENGGDQILIHAGDVRMIELRDIPNVIFYLGMEKYSTCCDGYYSTSTTIQKSTSY